jgi:hypothetical protein
MHTYLESIPSKNIWLRAPSSHITNCTCKFTYICTRIGVRRHTKIHTYTDMNIYLHIYMHTYLERIPSKHIWLRAPPGHITNYIKRNSDPSLHLYTWMYECICAYIDICMHAYIHKKEGPFRCLCLYYIHECTNACVHILICTCMNLCIYVCKCVCVHIYTCTCMFCMYVCM